MREKYVKLIVALQEADGYVKGSELAAKLNVSDRSIRSYIRDLNENYLVDAMIKNNKNQGYILTGEIKEIKRSQQIEFEERAFFIIKYLMERDGWATYDEIAEELLFSGQTIRNDVLKIQQLINDQYRQIKVESVIFQGIRLVGSEIDKRLFLDSLSKPPTLTNSNLTKSLAFYFKGWTSQAELEQHLADLKEQVEALAIPASSEALLPIIVYLVISSKRIASGHQITTLSPLGQDCEITDTREYEIARQLLEGVARQKGLTVTEEEIIYFSFYLMSQRLLFGNLSVPEMKIPSELRECTLEVLAQLEAEYQMPLTQDSQLTSGLLLHLSRDLYPLMFNFYIENAFITTIKQEYIQAYYVAVRFTYLMGGKMAVMIPENEIGYLALHFAAFIQRHQTEHLLGAVVAGRNLPAASLIKRELEAKIPLLQIQQVISLNELQEVAPEVQLLVSPVELPAQVSVPHVKVNELPSPEDIAKVAQTCQELLLKKRLKIAFFQRYSLTDKERILAQMLQEMDLAYLEESVIERERLSTTEVGNGVAIPHPLQLSDLPQLTVGVAVLERGSFWGSQLIQLIFLVIPGQQDQGDSTEIMKEIHRIINTPTLLENVKNATNLTELQALFA